MYRADIAAWIEAMSNSLMYFVDWLIFHNQEQNMIINRFSGLIIHVYYMNVHEAYLSIVTAPNINMSVNMCMWLSVVKMLRRIFTTMSCMSFKYKQTYDWPVFLFTFRSFCVSVCKLSLHRVYWPSFPYAIFLIFLCSISFTLCLHFFSFSSTSESNALLLTFT